jgi:hypothetical protein
LRLLGARLSKAAANVLSEIDGLYERHAAALEEGKKLISQAQSDRRDVINSGQLKKSKCVWEKYSTDLRKAKGLGYRFEDDQSEEAINLGQMLAYL